MTAHELRKHLAGQHGIFLWGAAYDHLVRRHEQDHISGADHEHDHDAGGDS